MMIPTVILYISYIPLIIVCFFYTDYNDGAKMCAALEGDYQVDGYKKWNTTEVYMLIYW